MRPQNAWIQRVAGEDSPSPPCCRRLRCSPLFVVFCSVDDWTFFLRLEVGQLVRQAFRLPQPTVVHEQRATHQEGLNAEQRGLLLGQASNPISTIIDVLSRQWIDASQKLATYATRVTMYHLGSISEQQLVSRTSRHWRQRLCLRCSAGQRGLRTHLWFGFARRVERGHPSTKRSTV